MPVSTQTGKLSLIIGPSGVGKSTIMQQLRGKHPEVKFARSATTRARRDQEGDDIYRFVSDAEFDALLAENKFLEWARVHGGARYGTLIDEIIPHLEHGKIVVREVDVQGFECIRHHPLFYPQQHARFQLQSIFILPESRDQLISHITGRAAMFPEELERRMQSMERELQYADHCGVKVINMEGQIAATRRQIESILELKPDE